MKKTSKILSLLVALCMAVTMLSGLTVMATEPFELLSYDADADFITLDFNQEIDTTNSVIVLKKGDAFVPFTIEGAAYNTTVKEASAHWTYKVIPTGGVELDEEYKITFWDVKSADGASTLAQSALTFSTTEIADLSDLVNIQPYEHATQTWSKDEETGVLTRTLTLGSSNMGNHAFAGALVGADTTEEHFLPNGSATTGSANWTEKEFTIKLNFKSDADLKRPNIVFGIARNLTDISSTSSVNADITALTNYPNAECPANAMLAGLYLVDGNNIGNRRSGDSLVKSLARTSAPTLDYTTGVEFKLSSKDNVLRVFVNGKKVLDGVVDSVAPGHPFFAIQNAKGSTDGNSDIEINGFQATQSLFEVSEELDTPEGYIPPAPPEPEEPQEPEEAEYPEMILDWDADLDFFTVDFEEEIASLDATITQAGAIIPATVYASEVEKTNNTRYTWIVKPADGFTRDIPYTVTLANVKNADGSKTISTWSKTFKVEVLTEGLSLEDIATNSDKASANAAFSNNGEDLIVTANAESDTAPSSGRINVFKSLGTDEGGNEIYESDYTVKVTYKNLVNAWYIQSGVGYSKMKTTTTNQGWDHNSMRGIFGFYGGNGSDKRAQFKIYQNSAGTNTNVSAALGISGNIFQYINLSEAEAEVKLAVKNGHAHEYINGVKAVDTALLGEIKGRPQIILNIRNITAGETASLTIADFVVTRAVHVDVLGESFTAAEPELTGAFTDATVAISTVVTNNTLVEKAIFAMCALYDATGAMKNIVISEVEEAATGETTVEFENVATNGATYAKIFIWDTASALNPYFPAIEVK